MTSTYAWYYSVCESTNCMGSCPNALFINQGFTTWGMSSSAKYHHGYNKGRGYYGMAWATNLPEVRIFMGLVGYYRRFVEGFLKIENPITEL
jgi:hypothetical protein